MEGKVALVIGSTSGFGLGIANQLAAKGCSIILTGLGSQELIDSIVNDFKSKYTSRVDFVPVDLRIAESVQGFCDRVTTLYPDGVDILVNNAGTIYNAPVEELPLDKWNDVMAVSVTSPFLLIKHFLPGMKKKQVFVEKNNPTKKPVEINEICGLVEFLCSSSACNMTGAPILVDAGFTSQ